MTAIRRVLAVSAVAAGAVGAAVVAAGGSASAMPTDHAACNAGQLRTTVVPQSPGAGQRGIQLQFSAKNGQTCRLSGPQAISLTHASGVRVDRENPPSFPTVTVRPGHPAHELLTWSAGEMADHSVTPTSIRIQTVGERGDVITVPWRFGSVADVPAAHELSVSPVEPGPATYE